MYERRPSDIEAKIIHSFRVTLGHCGGNIFHTFPKVPDENLDGAKSTFLKLKKDELLLGLYDGNWGLSSFIQKPATNGVAFTTKRIYWRDNIIVPSQKIEYAQIQGPLSFEPISEEEYKCKFGDGLTFKFFSRKTSPFLDAMKRFIKSAARTYNNVIYEESEERNLTINDRQKDLETTVSAILAELQKLVGLDNVKKDINRLLNSVKVDLHRKEHGLKTSPMSLHMVFYGPPGTGKTTVARYIGRIYQALGLLKKGHTIETHGRDLVDKYVGHTAPKTTQFLNSALGGVLFIDEAYTLKPTSDSNSNDFGQEAIETMLKFMEDNRDQFVIIVAGYTKEMERFLNSNPGLKSRFNNYLYFEDYSPDELCEIFRMRCISEEYVLSSDAETKLKIIMNDAIANKDHTFSNARFIRNLFDKVIKNQKNRIFEANMLDKNSLCKIVLEDFQNIGIKGRII